MSAGIGKYAPTETLSISAYYREEKEGGKREVQRGSPVHKRSPESPKIDLDHKNLQFAYETVKQLAEDIRILMNIIYK